MRKSLGDKRREIPLERCARHPEDPCRLQGRRRRDGHRRTARQEEVVVSRIFPTTHFGFRKITVERPLRLNFQASPERIARLEEERGVPGPGAAKKKGAAGAKEQAEGRALQEAIREARARAPGHALQGPRRVRARCSTRAAKKAGAEAPGARSGRPSSSALSERDETAAICRDKDGNPEPDPELRDTESVPLAEDVEEFFEREVKPHVPDAWIERAKRDPKDGEVGLVGYEINFNRYFYRYKPPRPLEEIEADIRGDRAGHPADAGRGDGRAARLMAQDLRHSLRYRRRLEIVATGEVRMIGASFDSTKTPLQEPLTRADKGKLQLPDFQRGWVWDDDRIRSLLASVSVSFPIGAVMLLQTGGEHIRFKPRPLAGTHQRLRDISPGNADPRRSAAPHLALSGPDEHDSGRDQGRQGQAHPSLVLLRHEEGVGADDDREDAVLGIPEDRQVKAFGGEIMLNVTTPDREYAADLFPAHRIFQSAEWRQAYNKHWKYAPEKIQLYDAFEREVIKRFEQYQVPVIELKKQTPKKPYASSSSA